jgi:hypothetical protein
MTDPTLDRMTSDPAKATAAATATGAVAGALAGAAAGLGTIALGPFGAIIGALVGATVGETASRGVTEPTYTMVDDEHYQGLWEASPDRAADQGYDVARPAYQFGHIAAQLPQYAGRPFAAAEPELQRAWDADLRAQYGEWTRVRRYVCDAYGHARAEGLGVRRDATMIGPAGTAVDPVELERARAGLASNPDTPEGDTPLFPTDLPGTSPNAADGRAASAEDVEVSQRDVHHERADLH